MAQIPLVHVGTRLAELAHDLTECGRQRADLDARITAILAEVRALGVPGAVVPSPNGTADVSGPRTPPSHTTPWPREPQPRIDPPDHRVRISDRVLLAMAKAGAPISAPDLAAQLREPIPKIRQTLRDLHNRYGRVENIDRGQWVVNDHGRQQIAKFRAAHDLAVASTGGGHLDA